MPLSFITKSFEKIIEDKDIEMGLEYLSQRATTIKAKQIIEMIKQALLKGANNEQAFAEFRARCGMESEDTE